MEYFTIIAMQLLRLALWVLMSNSRIIHCCLHCCRRRFFENLIRNSYHGRSSLFFHSLFGFLFVGRSNARQIKARLPFDLIPPLHPPLPLQTMLAFPMWKLSSRFNSTCSTFPITADTKLNFLFFTWLLFYINPFFFDESSYKN